LPFNELLVTALIHGTSYTDKKSNSIRGSKKSISLKPKSGEVILFFEIDNDYCSLKYKLIENKKIDDEGTVCDLLIFYSKPIPVKICFLCELKGDTEEQIKKGVNQINNVFEYLKSELEEKKEIQNKIIWLGCIISKGPYPKGKVKEYIPIIHISEIIVNDKKFRERVNSYLEKHKKFKKLKWLRL
jgi:hypothetical protein